MQKNLGRRKLIAGNWKMNPDLSGLKVLASGLLKVAESLEAEADLLVCPPFIYLEKTVGLFKNTRVAVGAQNCSEHDNGAYTGEISALMLAEAGIKYVILGHSERRTHFGEEDSTIAAKAKKAHENNIKTIICVGETLAQREQGDAEAVVQAQLEQALPKCTNADNTVIAYEPVWAIGTGNTATPEDAGAMHGFIRAHLQKTFNDADEFRILYGGSMKPDNAEALLSMPNIDGGLIGGASLDAESFLAIAKAV